MSRIALQFVVPDEQTMHDFEKAAEEAGLVVVTDGKVIQLARPNDIQPGFRRFALVDKDARRLDPKEPKA